MRKTANVLDKLPKTEQPAAKAGLREIWTAPDRATAEAAIATFADKHGAKYEKAVTCLTKDRDALLIFYDIPAELWDLLQTSNPFKSVFATVRHRAVRRRVRCRRTLLGDGIQAGHRRDQDVAPAEARKSVAKVAQGVTFTNGVEIMSNPTKNAA